MLGNIYQTNIHASSRIICVHIEFKKFYTLSNGSKRVQVVKKEHSKQTCKLKSIKLNYRLNILFHAILPFKCVHAVKN